MKTQTTIASLLILAAGSIAAAGAGTLPAEFDEATPDINRLYSYFGGVTSWSIANSPNVIHTGDSCQVNINFVSSFFNANGVGLGSNLVTGAALDVPADADTFSLTVQSPPEGTLSVSITIREDDNLDGVIDIGNGDDEWVSLAMFLDPGTNVYNIPFSQFVDSGGGDGNGIQNFTTSSTMAYIINFETRASNPGGLITVPVTMYIDHVGFYTGPQSIPTPSCPGDIANNDSMVDVDDLNAILSVFGAGVGPGDPRDLANADGIIDVDDLNVILANFGATCP